jgi:hypothetical protein
MGGLTVVTTRWRGRGDHRRSNSATAGEHSSRPPEPWGRPIECRRTPMRLGMRHGWSWCSRVVAPTAIRLQNDATDSSTSHRHKLPPGARPANEVCHRKYHCNEVRVLIFDRAGRPLYPGDGGALPAGDYPLAGTRRFPAAGPYGPADTSHRRGSPSRGVMGGSLAFAHHPEMAGGHPGAGKRNRFPPVFSLPAATGWNDSRFGFYPELRTRGHPRSTPGRRQALRALTRVLHLRHQPNLQTVPPTSLMHPHVAHNRRWLPSPHT